MRSPVAVTVYEGPGSAVPAILVHGTFTWGARSFEHQRPMAEHRRILIPDRRGFGASPDLDGSEYTADYAVDAVDVAALLADGAHLVGHSYGGTVAMLAAAMRPDSVRSLTLIEPCAHTAASDNPVVAAAIEDGRRFMAGARRGTAEEYLAMAYGDQPGPQPREWLLRAAATALHERPCWLADLADLTGLATAGFPKLVIVGAWDAIPSGYRPGMAKVMEAVSTTVADRIGARLVRISGAAHEPHREQPERVNALLAELWAAS